MSSFFFARARFVPLALCALLACSEGNVTGRDGGGGDDGGPDAALDSGDGRDGATDASDDAHGDGGPPCSLAPQGGCGAGERCGLSSTRQPVCVSIGAAEEYEDCDPDAADPCGAGFWCLRHPDQAGQPYQCTRFCTGHLTQGTCGDWDTCTPVQNLPVNICQTFTTCRPRAEDCTDDEGPRRCMIVNGWGAICAHHAASPSPIGGACASSVECVAGSSCFDGACRAHCDPDAAVDACPDARECVRRGPAGICR